MTAQKVQEVMNFYKKYLLGMGLSPQEFTEAQYQNLTTGLPLLEHCLWMLDRMEKFLQEGSGGVEKALGWMGFVQGCLAASQCFTIKELRDQSRTS